MQLKNDESFECALEHDHRDVVRSIDTYSLVIYMG